MFSRSHQVSFFVALAMIPNTHSAREPAVARQRYVVHVLSEATVAMPEENEVPSKSAKSHASWSISSTNPTGLLVEVDGSRANIGKMDVRVVTNQKNTWISRQKDIGIVHVSSSGIGSATISVQRHEGQQGTIITTIVPKN